jgi:hypothetical protein
MHDAAGQPRIAHVFGVGATLENDNALAKLGDASGGYKTRNTAADDCNVSVDFFRHGNILSGIPCLI